MTVDRSKLDDLINEQVKAIEEDFGDDWEIGDICCVVEAQRGDLVNVRSRFSGDLPKAIFLLRLAETGLLESARETGEDEG